LTPTEGPAAISGAGAMLLVTRASRDDFHARFVCPAMFIPCVAARDEVSAAKLSAAFKHGDYRKVRSLRRNSPPNETSWCAGNGWWLSTSPIKS
jgi:protein-L-isoaspartate(D-aspartate) O-methyltransferase